MYVNELQTVFETLNAKNPKWNTFSFQNHTRNQR